MRMSLAQQEDALIKVGFGDGGVAIVDERGEVAIISPQEFEDECDRLENCCGRLPFRLVNSDPRMAR